MKITITKKYVCLSFGPSPCRLIVTINMSENFSSMGIADDRMRTETFVAIGWPDIDAEAEKWISSKIPLIKQAYRAFIAVRDSRPDDTEKIIHVA